MSYHATTTYPCDPEAPARARAWALACVREALRDSSAPMLLDDAALVVSELMTNAIRAGGRQATLNLEIDAGLLRVTVVDDAPGRPHVLAPGADDESGRGLHIVSALATGWGVTSLDHGKEVWAELALIPARVM
jgi:anti-sigma regulatory factor (Ser/Thr protein kinase)